MKHVRIALFVVFTFNGFVSCAGLRAKPYDQSTRNMLQEYRKGSFSQAYIMADKLVKRSGGPKNRDYYLTLLERGKVALANGNYDQAIKDLQTAEKRFLKIEDTLSIREEVSTLFTHERGKEYEVEPHEMLLISPYLALAYLSRGDFPGAIVERNRAINKINHYVERAKKKYLENPFSRYVSALIYEMEGRGSEAAIEYRKIIKTFNYLKDMKKRSRRSNDLVILVDVGLAPSRYEIKYGPEDITCDQQTYTVSFAYAGIRPTKSRINRCHVFVDGTEKGKTRLLYNLEKTVMIQYNKTRSKRIGYLVNRSLIRLGADIEAHKTGGVMDGPRNAIIRAIGKGIRLINKLTIKADLRQWATLPKNIQYIRIPDLSAGDHTIKITYPGGAQVQTVRVKKDTVNILYKVVPY